MTDEEIITKIGMIISEMEGLRMQRESYARTLQDQKRSVTVAVSSCNTVKLKNPDVLRAIETIPRSKLTVDLIEYLTELEIGELAFQDAVIDKSMKMLMNELEAVKTLSIHVASVRKAERIN